MKVGISYKREPVNDKYDVIIIGSGMGALSTGAILAKEGKKVLLLEKHYTAGGFTHTFTRKNYEWDVGIHYIGSVEKKERILRMMFDYVTDSELEWADMGEVYDKIIFGEKEYLFVKGFENWKKQMKQYFPDQKDQEAIDKYCAVVYESTVAGRSFFQEKGTGPIVSALAGPFMRYKYKKYTKKTTLEVLQDITDNQELIGVLTGQYGDYGLPPSESSFAIHAMVVKHYWNGGAYPVGGSSQIAYTCNKVIEKSGGKIYINAGVEKVLVEDGKAVGVKMEDGKEIRSDIIVSNAGFLNTYGKLLDEAVVNKHNLKEKLNQVEPSVSHFSLYIGLNKTAAELGFQKANLWIYPDNYDHDENLKNYIDDSENPFPVTYISFPSAKDPDFENRFPGRSTVEIIGLAPYDWFTKWEDTRWHKRGDEYDQYKEEISQRLLKQLYRFEPQAEKHIDHYELSSPLTTRHFVNYDQGEIYGLTHTPDRFDQNFLRARTPIKNFYLTGQDIVTAGVGAALLSGVITASAITGKNLGKKLIKEMSVLNATQ